MISLLSVNSLAMHEESTSRRKADDNVQEGAVPAYLLDRENTTRAKVCHSCTLFRKTVLTLDSLAHSRK